MAERPLNPTELYPQVKQVSPEIPDSDYPLDRFDTILFKEGHLVVRTGQIWKIWWDGDGWIQAEEKEQKLYNNIYSAFNS